MVGPHLEANREIEVFDLIDEQIIRTIPYDTELLNVRDFGYFIYNDLLIISGGININNSDKVEDSIQYFNVSELLKPMKILRVHKFDGKCVTTYNVSDSVRISLDDYLMEKQEIIFELLAENAQLIYFQTD